MSLARACHLFLMFFATASLVAMAQLASGDDDLFQKGLVAYQSQRYGEARDAFAQWMEKGHVTAPSLHNEALAALQLDQKPLALALWRKALVVDPSFTPARRGRDLLETKMQMRPFERDSMNLWLHRNLEAVSLPELLCLNALLMAIGGGVFLRYGGRLRAAVDLEQARPDFPVLGSVIAVLFVITAATAAFKINEGVHDRGTVIAAHTNAHSLPADEGVTLFDLNGGSEVLVRQRQKGWTQVQNADGNSGWIKDAELLVTTEREQ